MKFSEVLRDLLIKEDLNGKEAAGLIGCSPSTISLWLNGDSTPKKERQKEIIEMLGAHTPDIKEELKEKGKMRTAEPKDIAKVMGISVAVLYHGLQQGVFPWGYAIKSVNRWAYIINADKFERVEGVKV